MDESEIRQLLAAGREREAFERIVQTYQSKVYHLALSMTRDQATAKDLAQEAFLRVWKALPRYDGRASFSTWIYAITRNVCLTEISRAKRRPSLSLDAPYSGPPIEWAEPTEREATAKMDIEVLLARLSPSHEQVLRLFYLEQKSYQETAELLGQPLGTVKTNLFRARQELARLAAETA